MTGDSEVDRRFRFDRDRFGPPSESPVTLSESSVTIKSERPVRPAWQPSLSRLPSRALRGARDAGGADCHAQHQGAVTAKYDCALSHERIARALSISRASSPKYVKAAEASGVGWAELAAADEARLRVLLGGTPRPAWGGGGLP